jgi:hypothetical protein
MRSLQDIESVSAGMQRWVDAPGKKTLGSLATMFEEKSFAMLFVVLLGVPALPLPTGGATHVFEVVAALLAVQLIAGRTAIWIPKRWRDNELPGSQKFVRAQLKLVRGLERVSKPRLRFVFDHRLSNIAFGLVVIGGAAAAFFAPPFTGLDTLPALGVVLVSLAVLLEDFLLVIVGLLVLAAGVALEIVLGSAAVHWLRDVL